MSDEINRPMLHRCTRRILAEVVVTLPILRRPDWPLHEAAAAVGTDVVQHVLHAHCTERTFIGADARLARIRRQCPVAVLTGRPQFQHGGSSNGDLSTREVYESQREATIQACHSASSTVIPSGPVRNTNFLAWKSMTSFRRVTPWLVNRFTSASKSVTAKQIWL